MTEIKLDYEPEPPGDLLDRLNFVRFWLRLGRPGPVVINRTRRGYHAAVRFPVTIGPVEIAAVQAILGSDWKRETYNLMRARGLGRAPTFWHERWNVLYARKL